MNEISSGFFPVGYFGMIPDCYDPVYQAEQLAKEQDDNICTCHLCRCRLFPGDKIHIAQFFVVCPSCVEELQDNIEILE